LVENKNHLSFENHAIIDFFIEFDSILSFSNEIIENWKNQTKMNLAPKNDRNLSVENFLILE
jgi:hypothetical protein